MRLDLALIRLHPELSRRRARDVIEKGQVTLDGALVREAGREVGERAAIAWNPHRQALPRARCSLDILHEDTHLLVVDKPAGLLSVPTSAAEDEDTALGRVRDYVTRLRPRGGFVERVHRLDRDTSGALAFALTPAARAGLIRTFRAHRIERVYLAIASGSPPAEAGVIDAPLREEWVGGRRGVARPGEPSRPARTFWRVRERHPGTALLEVTLETGRQHQIRAHLAHAGLPVLGDAVYGPSRPPGPVRARRPMLHAARLALQHPVTGERVSIECAPPDDFARVLETLRRTVRTSPPGRPARRPAPRRGVAGTARATVRRRR